MCAEEKFSKEIFALNSTRHFRRASAFGLTFTCIIIVPPFSRVAAAPTEPWPFQWSEPPDQRWWFFFWPDVLPIPIPKDLLPSRQIRQGKERATKTTSPTFCSRAGDRRWTGGLISPRHDKNLADLWARGLLPILALI